MRTLQGRVVPETIAEALDAWDAGDQVQTVAMADRPNFSAELVIQTAMFELLREFQADPEYLEAAKTTDDLATPAGLELLKRVEISLVSAEALIRDRYDVELTPEAGGQAATLATQIARLGFDRVREIARTRNIFIGNPAGANAKPNRAQRREIEARSRKPN